MKILAGDVGGTKTLLRLARIEATGALVVEKEQRYDTDSRGSLEALLEDFCTTGIDTACLAAAGPVLDDGTAVLTNLGWQLREESLRAAAGARTLRMVNDFWAVARAIPHLQPAEIHTINSIEADPAAPIGVLGAGTGLGEAILIPVGEQSWRILPSEGGHCDFAPIGEIQRDLHAFLEAELGHVSFERVVSGQGIVNIHRFLRHQAAAGVDPDTEADEIALMADGGDPVAGQALDIFVDVFGAEAGNLALKVLARGGIYLAGGIAPKHLGRISRRLMKSFIDKGRFESLMRSIPVHVITESRVGLIGAAAHAIDIAKNPTLR